MVDPVSGLMTGAGSAVTERVIATFFEGREDEKEEWRTAAVELATATQANCKFYLESSKIQQRETLQQHLEQLGKQAQELAVIGQQRGYDDIKVETVEDLAETCGAYSAGALLNDGSLENELRHNLGDVVPAVFELVELTIFFSIIFGYWIA